MFFYARQMLLLLIFGTLACETAHSQRRDSNRTGDSVRGIELRQKSDGKLGPRLSANAGEPVYIGAEVHNYTANLSDCRTELSNVGGRQPRNIVVCDKKARVDGVRIGRLDPSGPFALSGLKTGDVLENAYYAYYEQGSAEFPNNRSIRFPVRIKDIEELKEMLADHGPGDTLFVQFFTPSEEEDQSLLWQRRSLVQVKLAPRNAAKDLNYFQIVERDFDLAAIVSRARTTRNAIEALQAGKRSNGLEHVGYRQRVSTKPYSSSELASWNPKLSMRTDPSCPRKNGNPVMPKIEVSSGFDKSFKFSAWRKDNYDGYVQFEQAFLESLRVEIIRARKAFWESYNSGNYDQDLMDVYAFLLHDGKKQWQLKRSPQNGVSRLITNPTADFFDYPIENSFYRDAYQFSNYSDCSPFRSQYKPEKQGAIEWLEDLKSSQTKRSLESYIDYSLTSDWFLAASEERLDEMLDDHHFEHYFHHCARSRVTRGLDAEECFEGQKNITKTSDGKYYRELTHTQYKSAVKQAIEWTNYTIENTPGHACSVADAKLFIELFRYVRPALFRYNKNGNELEAAGIYPRFCKTGITDWRSDELVHPLSENFVPWHSPADKLRESWSLIER